MKWNDAMTSVYMDAIKLAQNKNQIVGEKNDYYITLEQLEALIRPFIEVDFSKL